MQLAVLMVGKQAINNVQELLLPIMWGYIDSFWLRRQVKKSSKDHAKEESAARKLVYPWEDDVRRYWFDLL